MISGFEVSEPSCRLARFESSPDQRFVAADRTVATVTNEGHTAVVEVKRLFGPRGIQVSPVGGIAPGTEVMMEWSPQSDEWSGYADSTSAHIYWPNDFSTHVTSEQLRRDGNRFYFAMPNVRPGPARIELSLLYLRATPAVTRCSGVGYCEAHDGSSRQQPTVVEVLPAR